MTESFLDKVKIDTKADAEQCHVMATMMVKGADRCPDITRRLEYLTFAVAWYEAAVVKTSAAAIITDISAQVRIETYKGRRVLGTSG
jgi:hypothetical protein